MDSRTFRKAMGHFATGVTIITTKVGEEIHGMTANAFMSVSLDPKLVAISIDNRTNMIHKIETSQKFAVSLLNANQKDLSMYFAGQKQIDVANCFQYIGDLPVIKDALAAIICDVDRHFVVGDHTIYIGRVRDLQIQSGDPLTFYRGQYGSLQTFQYAN